MATKLLDLGETKVDVVLKDIKNVHLSVHPPSGRVRIAAPKRMDMETVRLFAISKLGWIKQQQRELAAQDRESLREYLERESHYVWGKRYLLTVNESEETPSVSLRHNRLILNVRPDSDYAKRKQVIENWQRVLVRGKTTGLLAKWEPKIGIETKGLYVQNMKTRWGSCNPKAATIRLNTQLVCKPLECLEYIVVHEMLHVIEPTHNEHFQALMSKYVPDWKQRRQTLNRLPVRHEDWAY